MKISQEDGILIKNVYLSKRYGARRLLREFPDKGWKLESINSLLKRIRKTVTIVRHNAAVDRVRRVAVKDLVLSQEDKPKRHRSSREISCETAILCSGVHKIIHCDPQLKRFNLLNDVVLSCCLKPIAYPVSRVDK